jgi:hypothetical protein
MVEGATRAVGTLIAMLYDDLAISRDAWTISHNEKSRKTYAETLLRIRDAKKRQGFGVRDEALVAIIQQRATALGLTCFSYAGGSTRVPSEHLPR